MREVPQGKLPGALTVLLMLQLLGLLIMNSLTTECKKVINVGVSNRHVHLCEWDRDILFGKDYKFTYIKSLSQKGQFAERETVTLVEIKGSISGYNDEIKVIINKL